MWRVTTTFSGTPVQGGGINRLYFDSATLTAANAHAATVAFWNGIRSRIADDVTITVQGDVDDLNASTGALVGVTSVTPVSAVGLDSGDNMARSSQGLAQLLTNTFINGRQVRGRIFIPGPTEVSSVGGVPEGGYNTVINTALATLINDPNSVLLVWHRPTPGQSNGVGAIVSAGTTWNQWAVLRSRRD